MIKYMNIFIFLEKASGRLGEAPGGLRRAPEGLWTIFGAWDATLENMQKFTEECFAQHVVRSTLSVNFFGSKSRPAGEK